MMVYVTYNATVNGLRRGKLQYETIHKPIGAYIAIGCRDPEWIPDKYWFKNYASAVKNADRQRKAKIIQLENQIKRLEKMEFK